MFFFSLLAIFLWLTFMINSLLSYQFFSFHYVINKDVKSSYDLGVLVEPNIIKKIKCLFQSFLINVILSTLTVENGYFNVSCEALLKNACVLSKVSKIYQKPENVFEIFFPSFRLLNTGGADLQQNNLRRSLTCLGILS